MTDETNASQGEARTPGVERQQRRRRSSRRVVQVRRRRAVAFLILIVIVALIVWRVLACGGGDRRPAGPSGLQPLPPAALPAVAGDGVKNGTFLGNYSRRSYGRGPVPKRLDVLWKVKLGSGWSSGKYDTDPASEWAGSGWTGQPALVVDGGRPYIIASGYDYNLRRIDALNGKVIWKYKFDDIIKGSPSVFANARAGAGDDKYVVIGGSRRGYPLKLADHRVAPYRAVGFASGSELWRLPVPQTACYSRDCDGSGFFADGRQYIAVESGFVYALDPLVTEPWQGKKRPRVIAETKLLGDQRAASHKGNLVLESSLSALGSRLYVASGAGHVYGLRRDTLAVDWDYFIGSDLDGTVVPTRRNRLLVPVEKEYIKGHGGVLSLDPGKPPEQATEWFFPTGDKEIGDWQGGVIGSCAVNDEYNARGKYPALTAFNAVDGYLYVVSQDTTTATTVAGPNREAKYKTPVSLGRFWNAGSISTPLFVGDHIISAGFDERLHVYRVTYTKAAKGADGALPSANGDGSWWTIGIKETVQFRAGFAFESTPLLWDGRIYVGCRDGWFYCLGEGE